MIQAQKVLKNELESENVLPIKVQVELERHGGEDGCIQTVVAKCHSYRFGSNGDIDLFLVEYGRLRIFASFNGVLSVEEIDG